MDNHSEKRLKNNQINPITMLLNNSNFKNIIAINPLLFYCHSENRDHEAKSVSVSCTKDHDDWQIITKTM